MSISDRIFDAIANAIRVNDKVDALADRSAAHAQKIEALTERVVRLEATLDIVMSQAARRGGNRPAGPLRLPIRRP
jgi:hypothetical protein